MAYTAYSTARVPLRPSTLLAVVLLLFVAAPSMGEDVLARESDGNSGFGGFLKRLMIDIVAWLASLLGFSSDKDSADDAEYRGGETFSIGNRRIPTANPQDVESVPSKNAASPNPEFTSEEDKALAGAADANPSLVELIQGVGNLHGRAKGRSGSAAGADASVEQLEADVAPLAPERATE